MRPNRNPVLEKEDAEAAKVANQTLNMYMPDRISTDDSTIQTLFA